MYSINKQRNEPNYSISLVTPEITLTLIIRGGIPYFIITGEAGDTVDG